MTEGVRDEVRRNVGDTDLVGHGKELAFFAVSWEPLHNLKQKSCTLTVVGESL